MFQLRRILLSGLVALLMVGMVSAYDTDPADTEVDRSYIGSWSGTSCQNTNKWSCVHLEIYFDFRLP